MFFVTLLFHSCGISYTSFFKNTRIHFNHFLRLVHFVVQYISVLFLCCGIAALNQAVGLGYLPSKGNGRPCKGPEKKEKKKQLKNKAFFLP